MRRPTSGTPTSTTVPSSTSTTTTAPVAPHVVQLAAGGYFNSVLVSNGGVKCWGQGSRGQLGNGATTSLGANLSEMGDALPAVDLGL